MGWKCEDSLEFEKMLDGALDESETSSESPETVLEGQLSKGKLLEIFRPNDAEHTQLQAEATGACGRGMRERAQVRWGLVQDLRLRLASGQYDYSPEAVMERVHQAPEQADHLLQWLYPARQDIRAETV